MLWRVRTTMPDRPGALARLARSCGEREVNILALQIFPGVDGVTDELVLSVPRHWDEPDVTGLVARAGGVEASASPCTEQALVDGPTRFLDAVRRVAHAPEDFTRVLARLLDAEPSGVVPDGAPPIPEPGDLLTVRCGDRSAAVRRATPFTATEHARAHAFAAAVAELVVAVDAAARLEPMGAGTGQDVLLRVATAADAGAVSALHARSSAETVRRAHGAPLARVDARLARRLLVGGAGALVAVRDDHVVGLAALGAVTGGAEGACDLALLVEDSWQKGGIGTRLLAGAASLAAGAGATELVLRGPAESPAAVALAFGSGLRARMRLVGDELEVRVGTRGVRPFRATPDAAVPSRA